jgi:DNA-binding MarR family transcriptional regulator
MKKEKEDRIGKSADFTAIFFAIGRRLREEAKRGKKKDTASHMSCTLGYFAVLHYVDERGAPSMRDIAKNLFTTPPAITLLIEGMVKNKLLSRKVDPDDHRAARIGLTARGKRFLKEGRHRQVMILEKVFSVLDKRERLQLMVLLEKVATAGLEKK